MAEQAEEQKQEAKEEGGQESINLKVKDMDQTEVHFKVKRSTSMSKIMTAFCQRKSYSPNQVRFTFEGSRIRGEQTPNDLEMEDGDIIDAFMEQVGGAM